MKITVEQLRGMVTEAITEAKKKRKKDLEEMESRPDGHMVDSKFDFAPPLGGYNLYRSQGAVNWGPQTGAGSKVDDRPYGVKAESALRSAIRGMISEKLSPDPASAWSAFSPSPAPKAPNGIWESAMHYYDFQRRGLGQMKEAAKPSAEKPEDKKADKKKGKKAAAGRK
jgi:hypothetical protein